MIGIGPFLPHHDTPFCRISQRNGGTDDSSIIHFPPDASVRIDSGNNSSCTLIPDGRERGILAGANVVMPNLSPREERRKYELYNDKASLGVESAEGLAALQKQLKTIGYEISTERGDFKYTTEEEIYDIPKRFIKAEEFIHHEEILDTLEYAQNNKDNRVLIEQLIEKAALCKGLTHREAAILLECNQPDLIERIFHLAKEIKQKVLWQPYRHVRTALFVELLRKWLYIVRIMLKTRRLYARN